MTYSPGLKDVVAAETRLSHVDGEAGVLVIGGYPLEEIAERATYEEMVHLLWHGSLPTEAALDGFMSELAASRPLSGVTHDLLRGAAKNADPSSTWSAWPRPPFLPSTTRPTPGPWWPACRPSWRPTGAFFTAKNR